MSDLRKVPDEYKLQSLKTREDWMKSLKGERDIMPGKEKTGPKKTT